MTAIDFVLAVPVLALMAAVAIVDGRRMIVEPRLVLALAGAGLLWRLFGSGGVAAPEPLWTACAGAALGAFVVAAPILAAHLRRRRWPIFPGDATMLAGFGFVLGPLGLGWSLLLGSGFALAHRIWLQRRRGRPVRCGYCPLGPGMTAGAMTVFVCLNAGVALARDGTVTVVELPPPVSGPAHPIPAVELAPRPAALPAPLAAKNVEHHEAGPIAFSAAVRRIAALAGVAVEVEERPSRIAGGDAALPEPLAIGLSFSGPLPDLLDLAAARSGYDWTWRDGAIVFHRYWDLEQRAPDAAAASGTPGTASEASLRAGAAEPGPSPWIVDRTRHPTLREVLEAWAARAGWSVVWKPDRHFSVGADAAFGGTFLEAVDLLLSGPATRRSLVAFAHTANRHLVIEDAGAVR